MKLYTLLDQEDTGFADDGADIPQQTIEIAALVVTYPALEVERCYYARVRPTIPVLPGAARVNGYTPEAWEGYPELTARDLDTLADMMDGTQVVGSAPAYDDRILAAERARVGGRAPRLSTHRRLDVGSLGAPLVEALNLRSGGMGAIIAGLESIGLPRWATRGGCSTSCGTSTGRRWSTGSARPHKPCIPAARPYVARPFREERGRQGG